MSSKLIIQLVTWNGQKYIPFLFESLRRQTFRDWSILILDNASSDATVELIKNELINSSFSSRLIEKKENLGFAGGHNLLLKESGSEYVLFLNQDMYLTADCLQKMIDFLDTEPRVSALAPRLMRWNFTEAASGRTELSFTGQLDTLGLKVCRSRRVVEFHHGEEWPISNLSKHRYVEVFGVSGAFPLYRRSDLMNVAFSDGTLYDEVYNSYKEDVDLAFRFRSIGLTSAALLDAVVYHDRTAAGPRNITDRAAVANKKLQSPRVKFLSYKNHLATIYKNEYWQNLLLDFPWVLWYEVKKFFYYLFIDFSVIRGVGELLKNRKILKQHRREIASKRKVNWKAMRKWWS